MTLKRERKSSGSLPVWSQTPD